MKVLICHERFTPDFIGGGEIVVHETAKQLAALGVKVQVVTTGDPADDSVDGIPVLRLPIHPYRFNLAAAEVTRLANSVDLIQTFNYHACLPALAAGRRTGKPVVCGVLALFEDAWQTMRGPLVGRAFQYFERFLLRRDYARIFFLSEFSRQAGLELGVDSSRAFILPPGVDTRNFHPAEHKQDIVLFAARLDPRKGFAEFAATARALPQVRFRAAVWGQHPCVEPLYELANVEVLRCDRQQTLREEFSRARIFFFPSMAETYGMVLVEAMASGCAIASTIDLDYAGIKLPPQDVESMVGAIDSLWKDRARTAQFGADNIERARGITWERYAQILHGAYRELLGNRP